MPVLIQGTAAQWQRGLERAIREGLDVLTCPATGQTFIESTSHPGTLHQVTTTGCDCPAGQQGQVCKHLACYLAQIGEFPLGAPPAQVSDCRACSGCGVQTFRTFEQRCDVCQGRGTVALPVAA